MRTPKDLVSRIEAMRVEMRARHWACVPADLAARARPRVARLGDALATCLGGSDALQVNRVIGFGHRGGASEARLEEIVSFYRAAGAARFGLELGPGPQAAAIARWLEARGCVRRPGYLMLAREVRPPGPPIPPGVRVRRARGAELATVVDLFGSVFPQPPSRRAWALASVRRHGEHFLARVGGAPAGAGTLQVHGALAALAGGATLTRWRRHGAHAAVIAARLRRAARLGCRWAWSETSTPRPGRPGGSRRNLLRLGFRELGVKPLYVWRVK